MKILNLTQHNATPEQGCFEPTNKERVKALLTVEQLPSNGEILRRCAALAALADAELGQSESPRYCMIGGAPWMCAPLERALEAVGIIPMYAFSVRESADQAQPDGSVRKVAVFRHVGFIPSVKGEL